MGAPPMNLIETEMGQGQVRINGYGGPLSVQEAYSGAVTMGIRPEDVVLDDHGSVTFRVDILEELGAHRLLHGVTADQPFTVLVGKDHAAKIGETRISLKPNALRLFDKATGQRL